MERGHGPALDLPSIGVGTDGRAATIGGYPYEVGGIPDEPLQSTGSISATPTAPFQGGSGLCGAGGKLSDGWGIPAPDFLDGIARVATHQSVQVGVCRIHVKKYGVPATFQIDDLSLPLRPGLRKPRR